VPPLGKTDLFLEQDGTPRLLGPGEQSMTRPNHNRRLSNFQIGLIAIVLTFFGFYLAFTKSIPVRRARVPAQGGLPGCAEHPCEEPRADFPGVNVGEGERRPAT